MSGAALVYVAEGGRDVLAGRLRAQRRRGVESASFSYDDRFLGDPQAYSLDPSLPLVLGTLQTPAGVALFRAFADSAPDRWGRALVNRAEQLRARDAGTAARPVGELDLLLGVRDDLRQGALRFRSDQGAFLAAEDTGAPALADLPALLDLAARVEHGTADLRDLERLVRDASSLGGARPKAHVRGADGRIAIAKFPSVAADTWNVMAWERATLDLARDAGVPVADSQLVRLGDRHVLVVDRFDRDDDNRRIGYASAKTMLEASEGDRRSYLEIAAVLEQRSPSVTADLRQLWRRIAFSVLISNTDDHLRNHGFLHVRGDAWTLSPAFDLNPNPAPGPKHLTTAIDHTDTRARVDTLLGVSDYFRLTRDDALDALARVVDAVAGWRKAAAGLGLSPSEVEQMAPAFEHPEADRARQLTRGR